MRVVQNVLPNGGRIIPWNGFIVYVLNPSECGGDIFWVILFSFGTSPKKVSEVVYTDLSSKLKQVIEQVPKDVLYGFLCSYAQSHK